MSSYGRRFLAIKNKSFDLVYKGRKADGLTISEMGEVFVVRFFWKKMNMDGS